MKQWPWWHQGTGPKEYRIRELLKAVWQLHAMYGADDPWLWRGQANSAFRLEPGMHTRVRKRARLEDDEVVGFTEALLNAARTAALDQHEGTILPDFALLALLQHHGAATPLLDVTLDPIVGLYMSVVSPNPDDDGEDGILFAIKRPSNVIADFDSRSFRDVYATVGRGVWLYSAPDVSERLRIQRGHFVLGTVDLADDRVSVPLSLDPARKSDRWISKRMAARGRRGPVTPATSDLAVFRITAEFKSDLKDWLEARSGLAPDFIYPTPWHQPHLDRFAGSHGRAAQF